MHPTPVKDHSTLLSCPIGSRVRLWGERGVLATVLAARMGNVLVEYDDGQEPRSSHKWFIWTAGGGHGGGSVNTRESALEDFEKSCKFTETFFKNHLSKPGGIIMNGAHYRDGGRVDRPANCSFLGFGGSRWILRRLSDGKILVTNNLWHQGTIPIELRPPDNFESLQELPPTYEPVEAGDFNQGLPPLSQEQQRIVEH